MTKPSKQETVEALITVRLPKGLMVKVEEIIADRFSTKSEYIRDLIRKDVNRNRAGAAIEEVGA